MKKERIIYLDYLRVLATVAVVMIHVCSQMWSSGASDKGVWHTLNFYDSLVRWAVPIFLMISGALQLSRECDIKRLYRKNLWHLLVVYASWCVLYAVFTVAVRLITEPERSVSVGTLLKAIYAERFQLWFFPMIAGVYLLVPVLKQVVANRKVTRYFLLISGVLIFLLPTLLRACGDLLGGYAVIAAKIGFNYMGRFRITDILAWSIFYFVAGYFLSTTQLSAKRRKLLYILGICGLAATFLLNWAEGWSADPQYFKYDTANVAIAAIAIFVFIQNRPFANGRLAAWMGRLSKYSLGVCAVHVMIRDILAEVGIHTLSMPPVISVPVLTAVITAISFLICCGIGKIPFVGKWIQ